MRELRCAILGFGKMGRIRRQTLQGLPGCSVVAVYDPQPIADLPPGVRQATHIAEILEDDTIEVVLVCTDNSHLQALTVAALDAGKHVFCEKPPGRNLAELQKMIDAEQRNAGRKLMFGFNHRHHGSILHTKQLVDSGEYGKILWMRGRYGKSVDKDFLSHWRADKQAAGGGIFLDQGIHMLDLFLMLVDDFDEVKAFVSNLYWQLDIEDNVFAIFRNPQGQVASLHSTMTQWRHIFSLEIFLERGYITINGLKTSSNSYGDEAMTVAKNRTLPPEASWTEEENFVFPVDDSWDKELGLFVDAIRRDTPVPVANTRDALKLMRLVEKVYQEDRRG